MTRRVWELLDKDGHGLLKEWLTSIKVTPKEQAKLDFALNQLRTLDFGLVSRTLLAGPLRGSNGIYKLRLRCQTRELRPMLCRIADGDYLLLCGAMEKDGELKPADAIGRAEHYREQWMDAQKRIDNQLRRALY